MSMKYNLTEVYKKFGKKKSAFSALMTRKLKPYAKLHNIDIVNLKGGDLSTQGTYTDSEEVYDMVIAWADHSYKVQTSKFEREEHTFGREIVYNLFSAYKIIPQYRVLDYYIDWYIPELNLAIEFDESQHSLQVVADRERQNIIEEALGCKFLRYTA